MQCTIENRGLFMENNMKEESRLKFLFAENDTVIKFDDTKFYRDYFNKLPEAKGVDFISVAKDKIAFIEVKNCTGDEGSNRWRIVPDNRKRNTTHTSVNVEGRDSLDIEIAQKTAMTIAALVGAKSFGNTKECLNELKEYAYSDFEPLALNCAEALASLEDRELYEKALNTLSSNDDFEKLSAVKFLVAYGDKNAIPSILNVLKNSSMAENIAAEVPYLDNIFNILDFDVNSGLYLVNLIIDGLGEVTSLSQVFDYQLYDVICCLLNNLGSKEALIVLNAKEKFNTLTENDEYLYDEDKNTKNEIFDIKKLLSSIDSNMLENLAEAELDENSDFVLSAIDLVKNEEKLVKLTSSSNPTIVLKSLSALKLLGKLNSVDKNEILKNITDENIKAIIIAL